MNASLQLPTSAEEIGRRVLNWLAEVRGPQDLSPERIASAISGPVMHAPGDSGAYGIGNRIDERWNYTLRSLPADDGAASRMLFSFDDQTGDFTDFSAVCALDFDAYANALTAAGYTPQTDVGPRQAFNGITFTRDAVRVRVQVRSESASEPRHLCVSAMLVDAMGGDHG